MATSSPKTPAPADAATPVSSYRGEHQRDDRAELQRDAVAGDLGDRVVIAAQHGHEL